MIELPHLEAQPELFDLAYHLKGLFEAMEVIQDQAQILDAVVHSDLEKALEVTGRLDAELFTHVIFHLKGLRVPFRNFLNDLAEKAVSAEEAGSDPTG